jgi:hypothetical protein
MEREGGSCAQQFLLFTHESDHCPLEVIWVGLLDLPNLEVDAAHGEHVISQERELEVSGGIVAFERVPEKSEIGLLSLVLEEERKVIV